MSAFIVSPETMQRCISALHKHEQPCEEADRLGRELFALNVKAVQYRYPDSPVESLEKWTQWTWRVSCPLIDGHGMPDDRAVACDWLKALHCLVYQLSEGDEVPGTTLYARVQGRIAEIENHIAMSLPEYEAAAWDA